MEGSAGLSELAAALALLSLVRRGYNAYLEAVFCAFPGHRTQPVKVRSITRAKRSLSDFIIILLAGARAGQPGGPGGAGRGAAAADRQAGPLHSPLAVRTGCLHIFPCTRVLPAPHRPRTRLPACQASEVASGEDDFLQIISTFVWQACYEPLRDVLRHVLDAPRPSLQPLVTNQTTHK